MRLKYISSVLLGLVYVVTWSQTATVNLGTTAQLIRGFGGINHPVWIGDLTAAQRETAFGNDDGQMGMSVLRIWVSDNPNQWTQEVATAKRAIALGAIVFATPWNPPSAMRESFGTNSDGTTKYRLKYNEYANYAKHLNDFVTYMKNNGVDLYAISIQNEPDYAHDWTWWTAAEIVTFLKNNASAINCKIIAPESFQYTKSMSDPILNDATALANVDIIGAHLYGTTYANFPYPLFKQKGAGKELWMTEVYYPNSNANSADIWSEALETGQHIHSAMADAEFQTYVWWYIRRQYSPMKEDGTISKRGYIMSHYSKFVRPGYYRVDATKNPTTDVYVSAYKKSDDIVLVMLNKNTSSKTITVSIPNSKVTTWEKYVTSSSKNLTQETNVNGTTSFQVTLDAQSMTTFVGAAPVVCTPPAAPTFSSSTLTYCQNETAVALTATGTALKWYTVATGGTATTTAPTPSTATVGNTMYYVSQTVSNCESDRAAITVTVNAKPTATITASGATTFCAGVGVTLSANTGTGLTYLWKRDGTTEVGTKATLGVYYTSGSYTVDVTNSNNCITTSSPIVVTVNAVPAVPQITGDTVMCKGSPVTLSSSATTGNQWHNGATAINGATGMNYTATAVGVYSTTVTGANGCKSSSVSRNVINNANCTITFIENTTEGLETLMISPNPFIAHITLSYQGHFKYEIFDIKGQLVSKGNGIDQVTVGNELAKGLYLIKVLDKEKTYITKVIKE